MVPPPDAIERDDSDVTDVKGLPSISAAEDDQEDVVTHVKPVDGAEAQAEPPTQRRLDLPPRLPGVPASVAELEPELEPGPEPEPEPERRARARARRGDPDRR